MEWKDTMQSRAEGFFSQKQTTWKERIKKSRDKMAKSKRPKTGSFIRWFVCKLSLGSVTLLAAASRFLIQF